MKNEAEGKVDKMFKAITEQTNFPALAERPEWKEIQKKIVFALNSHDRLKARVEKDRKIFELIDSRLDQNMDGETFELLRNAVAAALEERA